MKVKGVRLTASDKREIERQIRLDIADQMKLYNRDLLAVVLWCLRETYGFGAIRLHRFADNYRDRLNELNRFYEMPQQEEGFICEELLRRDHIEITDYYKQGEGFVAYKCSKGDYD